MIKLEKGHIAKQQSHTKNEEPQNNHMRTSSIVSQAMFEEQISYKYTGSKSLLECSPNMDWQMHC